MTDLARILVPAAPLAPLIVAVLALLGPSATVIDRVGRWGGVLAALPALALAGVAVARAGEPALTGTLWQLDGLGAVFLGTTAVVGMAACAMSPAYLRANPSSRAGSLGSRRLYWGALFPFWAVLIAIPLVANLGVAWILLEATTAASAMLVAFSGKRSAIEAGWKYLVLTSLGLAFALLGIVILCVQEIRHGGAATDLDWDQIAARAPGLQNTAVLAAFVLIVAGLATKGGWAPVHNWLPDAHSEAPPPVSALLSASLLPTVALVAWRLGLALGPAVGEDTVQIVFISFGLASLAIAVPFLWRPLPWKRLLAYSSLEHMGVIVLAIGIDHPIATAGALVHVAGHGVAKSLGFSAAVPLLRYQPAAARRPPRGLVTLDRRLAGAVGVSLAALAGLPPSPLFVSEILVLAGGAAAGLTWVVVIAAALLGLGFLGMAHTLVEGLGGRPSGRRPTGPRGTRPIFVITCASVGVLLALAVFAQRLPDSTLVQTLAGGLS